MAIRKVHNLCSSVSLAVCEKLPQNDVTALSFLLTEAETPDFHLRGHSGHMVDSLQKQKQK